MKKARLDKGKIAELYAELPPMHPDLKSQFIDVPDDAEAGMVQVDGVYQFPALDVTAIIIIAERAIDSLCDNAYTKSPSRNARYKRKLTEALRYRDANYPHPVAVSEYPYLSRESAFRDETKAELADLIISRSAAFDELGSEAEAARAELLTINEAADPQTAADDIVTRIRNLAIQMEA